jgi:DNA-binding CsgD family transcriptional regulator
MLYVAPAKARLHRWAGEYDEAQTTLYDVLATIDPDGSLPGLHVLDALDILAGLAATEGSWEFAARIFGSVTGLREAIGYPRAPSDLSEYEADLATAREGLGPEAFDAAWAAGSAMALEEAIAYATRGRGARKRPTAGWKSLTPTELNVAELVAEGLTNAQIAERLFIAPGTVKIHLSHIFGKLGISRRAELAVAATLHPSESEN